MLLRAVACWCWTAWLPRPWHSALAESNCWLVALNAFSHATAFQMGAPFLGNPWALADYPMPWLYKV